MATINIVRRVYNDKTLKESFAKKESEPEPTVNDRVRKKWNKFSMREQLKTWFPIYTWLTQYNIRGQLPGDLLAGLTIGVVNIPQGMAFAALTLLPPVFGLYVSFFPVIFYVLMGSCHHQSWGGFGVTAIMSGDAVSGILDAQARASAATTPCTMVDGNVGSTMMSETLFPNNTTPGFEDPENLNTIIDIAITITMLVGIMQCIMGLLRLGFISVYLSQSFIQALTAGAACHVVTSQVPRAIGITIERFAGPFSIVFTWVEIFKNIPNINVATFSVSVLALGMLFGMSFLNNKFKDKLPVPIPMDMIVVVVITLLSFTIKIDEKFDVLIVDNIPLGFPTPRFPSPSLVGSLLIDSFAIALVTYAIDISLGKIIADKHGYKIDDNQEMLASGVANALSAPFLCYISGPSLARIWIVERAGGKTQLTSAVNCVLVLLIMLLLGQLLEPLPLAVLAILLIFSLIGMVWQVRFLPAIFRQSKWDFAVWVFTFTTVFFLGVALGLFAALGFSCIVVAVRLQVPSFREEGIIEGSELFLDSKGFQVKDNPNYTIFHMESSLCFLNVVSFRKKLIALSNFEAIQESVKENDIANVEISTTPNKDDESAVGGVVNISFAKIDETDKQETDSSLTQNKSLMANGETVKTPTDVGEENKDTAVDTIVTVETATEPTKEAADENSNEMSSSKEENKTLAGSRIIIINCCSFNFVDLDGSRMLANIIKECKKEDITVLLAACTDRIHDMLITSGQFDDAGEVFYPTILDAYTATQIAK